MPFSMDIYPVNFLISFFLISFIVYIVDKLFFDKEDK